MVSHSPPNVRTRHFTSRPRAEARTSCPLMLLFKTATDRPDNRDFSLQPACYPDKRTVIWPTWTDFAWYTLRPPGDERCIAKEKF